MREKIQRSVVVALALGLTVVPAAGAASTPGTPAGQQSGGEQESEAPGRTPAADAEMPEVSLDRVVDMILAKVDGEAILLSDLRTRQEEVLAPVRGQIPEAELQAQLPQIRRRVLQGLIEEKIILHRAEDMGITVSANEVDRAIERFREQQGIESQEELERALQSEGVEISELRDAMRKNLLQQRLLYEEVRRQIFVSDQEIESYYQEHMDEYSQEQKVRIRQLVFLVEGREPERVRRTAEAALAELRAGAAIEEIADRYEGARLAGGEEATPLSVSELMGEIADAVADLEPGQVSDVVRSRFGFHVVELVERQGESARSLDEVRDQIRRTLMQEKQQSRYERYLEQLRERSHVEIFARQFQDLAAEWEVEGPNRVRTEAPSRRRQR